MHKKIWDTAYYHETNRTARKKILDETIAAAGLTPSIELCQKIYTARYGESTEDYEVDYFIRGLMTLEYMKTPKGIWDHKKKLLRERRNILTDFQCELAKSYGEIGERIIYNEYCNLIKLYMELCERDRAYSSLLFGLGRMKRKTLEKKLADDIYHLAYVVPKALDLEEELSLFSQAALHMFCQRYPREAEFFHERIAANPA